MGCVTVRLMSGDNDEPIYPVEYHRYYFYCDHCGSFALKYWSEPKTSFLGRLRGQTDLRGVRCDQCQTTYEFGGPFFSARDANPRDYTMEDVPRLASQTYFEQDL